jgi:hypothetical protein
MRWAEGHTFNIKKHLTSVLLSPHISWPEKLEFLYFAPYYLQSALFIIGTLSWLVVDLFLRKRFPFWPTALGWSLVFTNALSLVIMNLVGLFMERGVRRNWGGLMSFILLTYLMVPFQAYAALKGLFETHEGGWHRTQKTGVITDVIEKLGLRRKMRTLLPKKNKKKGSIDIGERLGLPLARLVQRLPKLLTGRWAVAWRLAGSLLIGLLVLALLWTRMPGAEAATGETPSTLYFHEGSVPNGYVMYPGTPSGSAQSAANTTLSFYSDSFPDGWRLSAGNTSVSLWSFFEPGETKASLDLSHGSGSNWTSLGSGSISIRDSLALYEGSFATSAHTFSNGESLRLSITLPPNAHAWWDGGSRASSVVLPAQQVSDFRLAYLFVGAFVPVAMIEVTRRRRLHPPGVSHPPGSSCAAGGRCQSLPGRCAEQSARLHHAAHGRIPIEVWSRRCERSSREARFARTEFGDPAGLRGRPPNRAIHLGGLSRADLLSGCSGRMARDPDRLGPGFQDHHRLRYARLGDDRERV